jgi:16S rRNA (cytosine1402-N4)-methyltransferase
LVTLSPDAPSTIHIPVLLAEVLAGLDPQPGQRIVDGTLGGGGHTAALADRVGPTGRVLALDRDLAAVDRARVRFASTSQVVCVHESYLQLPQLLQESHLGPIDGLLLDLGLSSDQLADHDRGFSFQSDGPLDLRFDDSTGEPAWRWLERIPETALADVIYQFGEERFSRRIARAIVAARRDEPVKTAAQLASLVRRCIPRATWTPGLDPATRTFQALRIAVNRELETLEKTLAALPGVIRPGGRAAIISFHSLEDRIVKLAFANAACWHRITRKPIVASAAETASNPRARSAKQRVAEVVEPSR